jgi:hypothetical protein
VYVSGVHIYETYHPGAVVQIQGRDSDSSPWVGAPPGISRTLFKPLLNFKERIENPVEFQVSC